MLMLEGENFRYKWVVLAAASLSIGMSTGPAYAVGVLYPDWIQNFDASARYVSLVGSLPASVACLVGPLLGSLIQKFGTRACGITGGLLVCAGFALSGFAASLEALIVTFGLIAGFGVGIVNLTLSCAVNGYFLQNRAFAEGVVGAGLCGGMSLTALLLQRLSYDYTWRGAILVLGGVCLHNCVFAMFFVPLARIQNHPFNVWKASTHDLSISTNESGSIGEDSKEFANPKTKKRFLTRSKHLWTNPVFLLLVSCDFLTWIAIFVPYVHLVERARLRGVGADVAAWLSSACGIAGIIGRPVTGSLSSYFKIHPFWAFCANQAILGAATFFSPHWSDIYGLFALAIIVGFLSNAYGFMKASTAVMMGPENFVDAYSWMLLFEGAGISLGPFVAGMLYDATKSYDWSFRFSGALLLLSSALCFLKIPLERFRAEQKQIAIPQGDL